MSEAEETAYTLNDARPSAEGEGGEMSEAEETAYTEGSRMAWLQMLRECLTQLGYEGNETQSAAFAVEREETVQALRTLCREFGDNDWPETLHLADVINKHLGKHLRARA